MDIAVIGTGYVGLVTGVCLAELGNNVTCIDIDEEKVEKLNKGTSTIYEEGLEELLQKNLDAGHIQFTSDYKQGLAGKQLIYIAVGTPQAEDGSADLTYIHAVSDTIAKYLDHDAVIVTKSTVPMGTNDAIKEKIQAGLPSGIQIKIASNPEFLRQGSAVYDTFNGDRIVIGSDDEEALELLSKVNAGFHLPIVKTNLISAEMIKYASNAFLATKISFINEMANLSEKLGGNIEQVAEGMGMDKRIAGAFLNAGIGFGGSCFPKDTRAIISTGKELNYDMKILESVIQTNEYQRGVLVDKVLDRFGSITGKKVAVLGLAFKPKTDDLRDAPSILVTEKLLAEGAAVYAYDPVATDNAKKMLSKQINYTTSVEEAVKEAELAVILTEWDQIKLFPIENYQRLMANPVVFDGRNCLDLEEVKQSDLEYHSIGRSAVNAKSHKGSW